MRERLYTSQSVGQVRIPQLGKIANPWEHKRQLRTQDAGSFRVLLNVERWSKPHPHICGRNVFSLNRQTALLELTDSFL